MHILIDRLKTFLMIFVMFDDFIAVAKFRPVLQIASGAFVQHLGRSGEGGGQFLGRLPTFLLASLFDVVFATVQTAVDEFAAALQHVPGRVHEFARVGIAFLNECVQFRSLRSAFGLASFVGVLVDLDQAADARFEIFIAAQFEQAEEFLHAFLLGRVRARVDAGLAFGG